MKLDDKKFLAEWMGYKFYSNAQGVLYYNENDSHIVINQWHPDTDHKQFTEVYKKMTREQQLRMGMLIAKHNCWPYDIILNKLPKVMEAVLTVLREETHED